MLYYELVERNIKNRNKVVAQSELSFAARPFEAYCSMFGFSNKIVDWVKLNKTVSGFNGDYYLNNLWFDIDYSEGTQEENIGAAKTATINLVKTLVNNFEVSIDEIFIYFSGSKGFHVGLNQKLFGGFVGCPELPSQIKELAETLTEGLKHLDLGIYNKNRIFRFPNSIHIKTGLYKIPLTFAELEDIAVPDLFKLAKNPRRIEVKTPTIDNKQLKDIWTLICQHKSTSEVVYMTNIEKVLSEVVKNQIDLTENYEDWVKLGFAFFNEYGDEKGLDYWISFSQFNSGYDYKSALAKWESIKKTPTPTNPVTIGTLVHMARQAGIDVSSGLKKVVDIAGLNAKIEYIFKNSKLSADEIAFIAISINDSQRIGATREKISSLINTSAEKFRNADEMNFGQTLGELMPEQIEHMKPEKNPLTLGYYSFDQDLEGRLRGKVLGIAGMAGTKKSLLAQMISYLNAMKDIRSIYSSMEMAKFITADRYINMRFKNDDGILSTKYLANGLVTHPELMEKYLLEEVSKQFKDYIIITDSSSMDCKDYDKILEHNTRKHGQVDFLIVDGFSMMGGEGFGREVLDNNSKELKELAKKWNCCIIPILHVPKGVAPDKRFLFDDIRDSGKIKDNLDILISLSKCKDYDQPQDEEPVWLNDKIFAHFYNKRGSGAMIKTIIDLDTSNLQLTESDDLPAMYGSMAADQHKKQNNKYYVG